MIFYQHRVRSYIISQEVSFIFTVDMLIDFNGWNRSKIRMLLGYEKIPIIGVTAGNIAGEREKCLEYGMADFLPKPFKKADLQQILKKYISADNSSENRA